MSKIGRQLALTPERLQIRPGRGRHGQIVNWRWYCPCCDSAGTATRVSWGHPDYHVPQRDRCFRRAYQHLQDRHGYIPVGTQLELG